MKTSEPLKSKTVRGLMILLLILGCLVGIAWATTFSFTYDTATPAGSDDPAEADDRMREIKAAVQERLAVEHRFALTGTEVSDANTGEHTDITTDSIVNAGALTNAGAITAGTTLDVTGNIDPTTYETTNGGFLDEDDMASDANDKVASQQSIKKYVDDAHKPTGRLHLASNQLNLVNSTWTKVGIDTISTGFSDSIEDTTNNKITPAVAGYYLIAGSVKFTNAITDKAYQTKIYKNGDTDVCQSMVHAALASSVTALLCDVVYLDADDYVQLYAFSGSGGNTVDIIGGSIHTYLSLQRLR